jgi:hypothetical protein
VPDSSSFTEPELTRLFQVGFFSDHESIEEDDYTEFVELATEAQVKEDVYFGVVTDEEVARFFIRNKTIDRTPSFLLVRLSSALHLPPTSIPLLTLSLSLSHTHRWMTMANIRQPMRMNSMERSTASGSGS